VIVGAFDWKERPSIVPSFSKRVSGVFGFSDQAEKWAFSLKS
jgi:hypothetical protein